MKRALLVLGAALVVLTPPTAAIIGGQLIEARASAYRQLDPQTLPRCAAPVRP